MGPEKDKIGISSKAEREPSVRHQHGEQEDDPCRCKQVAVMTPKQLLGTMLKDLAFWKKDTRKG